jgi:hypothetical protein
VGVAGRQGAYYERREWRDSAPRTSRVDIARRKPLSEALACGRMHASERAVAGGSSRSRNGGRGAKAFCEVDLDLLREFELGLDPQHPERSRIPARILGYGEISTVFEIQAEGMQDLALKRLPLFHTREEVERYRAAL